MKKIIILIALSIVFFSCEKDEDVKQVTYLVANSASGFTVTYTDDAGEKIGPEFVDAASKEDDWTMNFMAEPGQILYLSVEIETDTYAKVQIQINGKVYKQGVLNNDSTTIVVSGVVPFN